MACVPDLSWEHAANGMQNTKRKRDAIIVSGAALAVLAAVTSGVACDGGGGSNGPGTDGDVSFCLAELIDAGLGFLCDGGFDASIVPPVPTGGGPGGPSAVYLKFVSITGTCKGVASEDNKCTLMPADYTTTIVLADSPTRGAGVVSPGGLSNDFVGGVYGGVTVTQPAPTGSKICGGDITPRQCRIPPAEGTNTYAPFPMVAVREGGSGESTVVRFTAGNLYEPTACTGNVFTTDLPQGTAGPVPLSPTYSIGALRKSPVTLSGFAKFDVDIQGLVGTVTCDYTVELRPSNEAGD